MTEAYEYKYQRGGKGRGGRKDIQGPDISHSLLCE